MKPRLLIVDDDEEIRTQMKWALAEDYDISLAQDRPSAVAEFKQSHPLVVLLDLGLPPHPANPQEGLATLSELLAIEPATKIVIVSGQGEKENALKAIGTGAYDFLGKPVDVEELKLLLKRCFHVATLEREYQKLQKFTEAQGFEGIIGGSVKMQGVFDSIRKVATADVPVLILGESGTGKELVAQAIHNKSSRNDGPFIAINCSAIPETLLESELFGHEKGAFTGATSQVKGRIETAAGGTLFLDEIGEVPLPIQVKLLRFLQQKTIERVGGRTQMTIDARVVAATNADLKKGMTNGTFREDLFYRLAVVQIVLPPLRDRETDIELLAKSFLQRFGGLNGKPNLLFSQEALRAMNHYKWPGNVRELENRVRRAVIMAEGKRISAADLELADVMSAPQSSTLKDARENLEREMVQVALRKHSGKITSVAAELGISRPTLYELMDKLGIVREPAGGN
jgi:two-component system NtrC family response regulator